MKKLLLILLIIICGCSTIHVKKDNGFGHPYEGITYSAQDGACNTVKFLLFFPPALLIIIPYYAVDMALSTVSDTLILPVDLTIKNDKPKLRGGNCIGGP